MKKNFVVFPVLALGFAALAAAQAPAGTPPAAPARTANAPLPTKVAIINVTAAIAETSEGKKAIAEMQTKFNPRKTALEQKQSAIQAKQDQMKKGSATMSDDAKAQLARTIDADQKSFQRDVEDLNADVDQENNRIMQEIGNKMMAIIDQYAVQNGIAVVLDVSNQQNTTVLWASTAVNITQDLIKLYDQAHPATGAPAAAPRPSAAKPSAPPATKK